MTSGLNKRDLPWIAVVAASFLFGLAVSWQQWGSPLVDRGREMNQPLRLAGGEMLYSDVGHIYGPLSPYLHAALFRQFGASLDILYADGIITAAIILALVYWLARQLMSAAAAAVATASVTWFCVFRHVGGNYILPYSYGAVHGLTLALGTLALLVATLRNEGHSANQASAAPGSGLSGARSQRSYFLLAGMCAGLATLAKTEMGFAALAAGITAAVLVAYPNVRRGTTLVGYFLAPAMLLIVGVYSGLALRVGWDTLAESWVLPTSLPPELVYFNKRISGFDRPVVSLSRMFESAVRLGMLAALIAATSWVMTRASRVWETWRVPSHAMQVAHDRRVQRAPRWPFVAGSLCMLLLLPIAAALYWGDGIAMSTSRQVSDLGASLARRLDWGRGRYLAMPLVLVGLLIVLLVRFWRARATLTRNQTIVPIVCAVYALASLPRVFLLVRTDGVYSSYLLPAAVVMFIYCWVQPFAAIFTDRRARRMARIIVLVLIFADVTVAGGVVVRHFRDRATTSVSTARGTMIATPDLGQAWNEALAYIERHTTPADAIAVLPEGTSLNFLSGRRNPLREEIITPGFLDEAEEARAIRQLRTADTRLILITNRPTFEFSATIFGRDYNRHLMRWIEENYEPVAMFGPDKNPGLEIGNPTFFIRAYYRKPNS